MRKSKKVKESKDIARPLTEKNKNIVSEWISRSAYSPIQLVCISGKNGLKLSTETCTEEGSNDEKNNLIHASICCATGARSSIFGKMLLSDCIKATGLLVANEGDIQEIEEISTGILDSLYALHPVDEIEGMLITRLIILNTQVIKYITNTTMNNQTEGFIDLNINRYSKLIRLFNETLESLMKYRRKGEQKIVIHHVNVNDGGQAMVGNFQTGGGGGNKNSGGTP